MNKMKKQRNIWKIIAIISIIILIFILINQDTAKDKYIEYEQAHIDNCILEFETCLDNVTLYNLEHKIQTTPSDSKILSCLWRENSCIEIQRYDYELWKAMGRPELKS
jgi:hypothetical protein